jgi:hypothetical protein
MRQQRGSRSSKRKIPELWLRDFSFAGRQEELNGVKIFRYFFDKTCIPKATAGPSTLCGCSG